MKILTWLFQSNPEAERLRSATDGLAITLEEINANLRLATGLPPVSSGVNMIDAPDEATPRKGRQK